LSRLLTRARLAAAAVVVAALGAGAFVLTPSGGTYIFLPDDAHPTEPLVTVEGGTDADDAGGIYYVDVIVRRATLLERVFPGLRDGSTLVPAEALNPHGTNDEQRRQRNLREMRRSQQVAAAVALRELGYDVDVRRTGALISEVVGGTPAAGKLRATDVVTAVDAEPVRTPAELRRLLRQRNPGEEVTLTVRRGAGTERVTVTTAADPTDQRRSVIGVIVDQAANIDLPVKVEIDAGNVGGPSAGLAFALTVMEELGRDVDRGHRVAVTGALELDGDVVPVGGLEQKTVGAKRSDADVFLVPAGENAEEARRHADGLRIIPVNSFQQALRALATLPESSGE
jgi:Lon-like protease